MTKIWAQVVKGGKWHAGVQLRCYRIRTKCGKQEKIHGVIILVEPHVSSDALCGTCKRSSS